MIQGEFRVQSSSWREDSKFRKSILTEVASLFLKPLELLSECDKATPGDHTPVVQTLDSTICRINHYPVDKS